MTCPSREESAAISEEMSGSVGSGRAMIRLNVTPASLFGNAVAGVGDAGVAAAVDTGTIGADEAVAAGAACGGFTAGADCTIVASAGNEAVGTGGGAVKGDISTGAGAIGSGS